MVPARHRRGPTQGKLSRSGHFWPSGPAANAKTAREPDEKLGYLYLSCKMAMAMASFVAAPHHHGSHLAAGFPFSARAGRSVGRSGATITMRAQVDAQPELTSSVSLCFSSHSSPNSHTLALVLFCSKIVSQKKKSNSDSGSSSGGGDGRASSGRRVWRRRKLVCASTKQCLEFRTYLTRHGSQLAR